MKKQTGHFYYTEYFCTCRINAISYLICIFLLPAIKFHMLITKENCGTIHLSHNSVIL